MLILASRLAARATFRDAISACLNIQMAGDRRHYSGTKSPYTDLKVGVLLVAWCWRWRWGHLHGRGRQRGGGVLRGEGEGEEWC